MQKVCHKEHRGVKESNVALWSHLTGIKPPESATNGEFTFRTIGHLSKRTSGNVRLLLWKTCEAGVMVKPRFEAFVSGSVAQ